LGQLRWPPKRVSGAEPKANWNWVGRPLKEVSPKIFQAVFYPQIFFLVQAPGAAASVQHQVQRPDGISDQVFMSSFRKSSGSSTRAGKKGPPKAKSAYIIFCAKMRSAISEKLKKEKPEFKQTDVMRQCGVEWLALGDADKKPYADSATADKERYKKELNEFEAKERSDSSEPPKKRTKKEGACANITNQQVFQVFVKTPNGTVAINVSSHTTTSELTELISLRTCSADISSNMAALSYLVYGGKKMANCTTMEECKITKHATLMLRSRIHNIPHSPQTVVGGAHQIRFKIKGRSDNYQQADPKTFVGTDESCSFDHMRDEISLHMGVEAYFLRFRHKGTIFRPENGSDKILSAEAIEHLGLEPNEPLDLEVELQHQLPIDVVVDAGLGQGETKTTLLYPFVAWDSQMAGVMETLRQAAGLEPAHSRDSYNICSVSSASQNRTRCAVGTASVLKDSLKRLEYLPGDAVSFAIPEAVLKRTTKQFIGCGYTPHFVQAYRDGDVVAAHKLWAERTDGKTVEEVLRDGISVLHGTDFHSKNSLCRPGVSDTSLHATRLAALVLTWLKDALKAGILTIEETGRPHFVPGLVQQVRDNLLTITSSYVRDISREILRCMTNEQARLRHPLKCIREFTVSRESVVPQRMVFAVEFIATHPQGRFLAGVSKQHATMEQQVRHMAEVAMSCLPGKLHYDQYCKHALEPTSPIYKRIAQQFNSTKCSHLGLAPAQPAPYKSGTGRHHRPPPQYEIRKIERLNNPRLKGGYIHRLENTLGFTRGGRARAVHGIDSIAVAGSEANEYFLLHGCPTDR
jgi:hypothetical protein